MPLIAILKSKRTDYYDDTSKIIESISEWTEVTTEELKLLKQYFTMHDYEIIERVDTKPEFVVNSVKKAVEHARLEKEKQDKLKEEAERKKQERLLKKKAKDEAAEKKLLVQLKTKYEQEYACQ